MQKRGGSSVPINHRGTPQSKSQGRQLDSDDEGGKGELRRKREGEQGCCGNPKSSLQGRFQKVKMVGKTSARNYISRKKRPKKGDLKIYKMGGRILETQT